MLFPIFKHAIVYKLAWTVKYLSWAFNGSLKKSPLNYVFVHRTKQGEFPFALPLSVYKVTFILEFICKLLNSNSMWFIIQPYSLICVVSKRVCDNSFSWKIKFICIPFVIFAVFQNNYCIWSSHKRVNWSIIDFFQGQCSYWRILVLIYLLIYKPYFRGFKQKYCGLFESIWIDIIFLLSVLFLLLWSNFFFSRMFSLILIWWHIFIDDNIFLRLILGTIYESCLANDSIGNIVRILGFYFLILILPYFWICKIRLNF